MVKSLDESWSNTRYGRAHKTPGKQYRLNIIKFADMKNLDIESVNISEILDLFEKDLEEAHEHAVIETFSRHITFVHDAMKVGSDLYSKEVRKPLSPWDLVKEMYYNLSDRYDCYSFTSKITLTRLDETSCDYDFWPIYADFNHMHISEAFLKLKYIEKCQCEDNRNNTIKPRKTCKVHCANKHANIESKYLATKTLFKDRSFKRMYSELYPTSPAVVEAVLSHLPPSSERVMHLTSLSRGIILERLSVEEFDEEVRSAETLREYVDIIKMIGTPSIKDLNSTHVEKIENIGDIFNNVEEGEGNG